MPNPHLKTALTFKQRGAGVFSQVSEARVAHSDALRGNGSGEPEWSLRNGGCVDGLTCEDENEGRGKNKEEEV